MASDSSFLHAVGFHAGFLDAIDAEWAADRLPADDVILAGGSAAVAAAAFAATGDVVGEAAEELLEQLWVDSGLDLIGSGGEGGARGGGRGGGGPTGDYGGGGDSEEVEERLRVLLELEEEDRALRGLPAFVGRVPAGVDVSEEEEEQEEQEEEEGGNEGEQGGEEQVIGGSHSGGDGGGDDDEDVLFQIRQLQELEGQFAEEDDEDE
jgi:hypothetical protein